MLFLYTLTFVIGIFLLGYYISDEPSPNLAIIIYLSLFILTSGHGCYEKIKSVGKECVHIEIDE